MTTVARPILFSGPMITALLEGRKTQTRRLIKTEWNHGFAASKFYPYVKRPFKRETDGGDFVTFSEPYTKLKGEPVWFYSWGNARWLRSPYGQAGDLLWVRECHSLCESSLSGRAPRVWYWADGNPHEGDYSMPRPSIHMPRWASRLTLKITDVRIEQLQDISEDDAKAEGSQEPALVPIIGACWSERDAYAKLWDHINGDGSWAANPWVLAVSFEVLKQNVVEATRAAA